MRAARMMLVSVVLMGCSDGGGGGSPDATIAIDAAPDAPTCEVDTARSCTDPAWTPYACSDGKNPGNELHDLRCADTTGREQFCCCVATHASQTWPCLD